MKFSPLIMYYEKDFLKKIIQKMSCRKKTLFLSEQFYKNKSLDLGKVRAESGWLSH